MFLFFVLETLAVRELQQLKIHNPLQEVDLGYCVHLSQRLSLNPSTIPVVHPKIFQVKQGNDPNNVQRKGQEVQFDDLLSSNNPNRFVCLVGPPGVGKTTLSKRLANNSVYELSLHLNFASINYTEKMTLQELLLDKQFASLDFPAGKCQQVFSWITNNQSKCLLVIDGLDQAQFDINEQPPNETYDAHLNVSTIIACLFKKIFLPNVRIIVTSRPHAVLDLHSTQRPDLVCKLEGLSDEGADKLLPLFFWERYDEFSSNIRKLAPELKILGACPRLLQIFVLSQFNSSDTIGEAKTLTRIFATVLENLQMAKNVSADFQQIQDKLARLAYNAFMNKQIFITWQQATDEGLTKEEIQDLTVAMPDLQGGVFKVLDSHKFLYFSHQMIHKYYCALHVWNSLSDEDFHEFFCKNRNRFKDEFIVVKKFLYGFAYDICRDQGGIFFQTKNLGEIILSKSKSKPAQFLSYISKSLDENSTWPSLILE